MTAQMGVTDTVVGEDLHAHQFRMLIDGELVTGASDHDVINPATEDTIGSSPVAGTDQVVLAVSAAKRAFAHWSRTPVEDRAAALQVLADAVESRADEFARIITLEQGKPLALARGDVDSAVAFTRYFAGLRPEPEVVRDDETARIEIHRKPLGIVAAILPWNFPFFQAMYKIAPALLMGNTLVVKPAPTTPLNTMLLGEMVEEILPPGVLNIVGDDGAVGPVLTSHPDIAKVSFTGSTAVGKAVMRSGADTLKRITLELGGNDAAVVLDDADVEKVADGLYNWAYFNAGQVCINIKRIFAPDSLYDALCNALAERVRATKVGNGLDPDTQMGPLQNAKQFEAAKAYLRTAKETGRILAGGNILDGPGYFVEPTLVADIEDDNPLIAEETFGPVRTILRYHTLDEVIARVNDTHYGLGNSVWSSDTSRAAEVANRLESGTTWVNQHFALSPDVPFGGRKQSGLGVEFGVDGLHAFSDTHVINISKV
ncbi:aldehyde dehydrogenase family protein [Rhodococcus sp. NPDC057529]|uniref:aldehyde dehydrogenase family protein n=1 Tax=Rhodococcus sp. NPDC057529 TaxID=3346158 RepID=UPI00366D2FDD